MEELILEQLDLGELSPEAKQDILNKIAYIYSAKLIEVSASKFSDLEQSRIEYLIEQKDDTMLRRELQSHIPDSDALLMQVANETIAELRENMIRIGRTT